MAPSARDLDLRQHHGIETPEHVDVHFELAGAGSRMAAGMIDVMLISFANLLISLGWGALAGFSGGSEVRGWLTALIILLLFAITWGYFTLFEALNGGRTPGKQALGIRVVMDTGHAVTPGAAVVRNLVRFVDSLFPMPVVPAVLSIFLNSSNKRPGDMAAGTIVVRDRPTDWAIGAKQIAAEPQAVEPIETGPPDLSEDEFRLLDRFLGRLNELTPEVQARITADLVRRFESRIPRRSGDAQAYLVMVFAEEQRKRRSRFATRAQTGSAGRITVTAERFVAKKRETWEQFRATAIRMERLGVDALGPGQIPEFAAQYREVAADLARARTYHVDPSVIDYLQRVVSAGHNALYRARGRQRTPLAQPLLRDFPAAVVQSWQYVVLGFLLFMIPAAVGYVMIRERPALAEEIVSPVMIQRAEEASERQLEGRSYAQEGRAERPIVSALIMSNNINISFLVFAGGLTAGLLTAWLLFTNGMMLGTGMAVFHNYNVLGYLLTFVAGHGVLELTAIFISAGAGFRLAKALIAPGDRTRMDALIVEGRIAGRMIGAVVTLLAIAGTIEGLLSTSNAPAIWKYGVSAATSVFLILYLMNGRRHFRQSAGAER